MIEQSLEKELLEQAKQDGIQKLGVGALIFKDGKILIVRRASGEDFLPNMDEVPSGGVDTGETLGQALVREVKEETGLDIISVGEQVGYFDYLSGSGKKSRQWNFLVSTVDGEVILNPDEHSEYWWVSMNDKKYQELNPSDEMHSIIVKTFEKL